MYSHTLPNEAGYYWTRDECGRTSIACVFEEVVWDEARKENVSKGWRATFARGGVTLPLEDLHHRQWQGPIQEPKQ
jgi:hypothetical protein